MKAILAVFGIALATLAGCAPMPRQGMAPSPPTQAAGARTGGPALPEEAEPKPMPPADVRTMKCGTLNSASDDDKAYASTFLLGYRSAMVHSHVLDTKQIDAVVQAAVAECAAKPEESAYRVFAAAQVKVAAAEHPPARQPHHKLPATPVAAPATTPAEPALSPPLHYTPSPATPMEPDAAAKAPEEKAATAPPAAEKTPAPTPPAETAPAAKPAEPAGEAAKPTEAAPAKPAAADSSTAQPASEAAPAQPKPADNSASPPSSVGGSRE